MDTPSPSMREVAQRLLALSRNASPAFAGSPHVHEAVTMCETLRIALTKFAGADGFSSLLRRALALARAEAPSLQNVRLSVGGSNCHMEGLEEVAPDAAVSLAAHLLGLLETFIGKPLTLRLVREGWPDVSFDV